MSKTKKPTLSVGETARRLDVSPDTVRNYCERGWLDCIRGRGNHRRISLRSVESFEAQRRPDRPNPSSEKPSSRVLRVVEEDFEIYYLGNEAHPNGIEPGYICNASFLSQLRKGMTPSTISMYVGQQFGGGSFRIVRIRDGEVVSERTVYLPGPTKDDVPNMREVALDL
jgi:excisionase family DNA binding protein